MRQGSEDLKFVNANNILWGDSKLKMLLMTMKIYCNLFNANDTSSSFIRIPTCALEPYRELDFFCYVSGRKKAVCNSKL